MRSGRPFAINWKSYLAPNFRPPIAESDDYERGGCGTNALSVITGKKLSTVAKWLPRSAQFWTDRSMLKALRERGYEVHPITIGTTCWAHTLQKGKDRIDPLNVILTSNHAYREEGTWTVSYALREYHSGSITWQLPTDLINFPIWSAYLVYHKKWRARTKFERNAQLGYERLVRKWMDKSVGVLPTVKGLAKIYEEQDLRIRLSVGGGRKQDRKKRG